MQRIATLAALIFMALGIPLHAQQFGTNDAISQLLFYDSSSNLQYLCRAPIQLNAFTWAVTPNVSQQQGTLTSIVVLTNVGTVTTVGNHGLAVGNLVTVAGSTTAALNGVYVIATVPSATTFTIATSGVANATYNTAALALSTNAPRSNVATWSIQKLTWNSGGALTNSQWATKLSSGQSGTTAYNFACDSRATYAYQ